MLKALGITPLTACMSASLPALALPLPQANVWPAVCRHAVTGWLFEVSTLVKIGAKPGQTGHSFAVLHFLFGAKPQFPAHSTLCSSQ